MTTPPILIIAVGNESRGDDALGPLLLRQLNEFTNPEQIDLLEDFQLQVEHAADLIDRDLVLFIDAGMDTPAPYSFRRIQPEDGRTLYSHALSPQAVLTTYVQVYQENPPPSFVLCVRGEQFELGAGLTRQAGHHLESSLKFLQQLLQQTHAATWDEHCI